MPTHARGLGGTSPLNAGRRRLPSVISGATEAREDPEPTTDAPPAPAPAPKKQIDPEAALEKIAASKGNPDLNWRTSIVDLMKLIGMDASLANRKELATKLGYTGEKNGSAEMNLWLHQKVMDKIRNG